MRRTAPARVAAALGLAALTLSATVTPGRLDAREELVPRGAEWRYFDGASAPEGWATNGFDASGWKTGRAPLGYGDRGLATTLGFGDDPRRKHPAAFFRRPVVTNLVKAPKVLAGRIRCDDGAAIYWNGAEVARVNLPPGPVGAGTFARDPLSGAEEARWTTFTIPAEKVAAGQNVLAVSVHQAYASSSDLAFDLDLAVVDEAELPRRAVLAPAAAEAVRAYHKEHYVGPGMTIPDGYVDGGTYMEIGPDGTVEATREVITVDRTRDAALRRHLEFARWSRAVPSEVERARTLAAYIDRLMTPDAGRRATDPAVAAGLRPHTNTEVLLGDVPSICNGAGVCRHRALLLKLMADEAALKVSLRRGHLAHEGRPLGRHAWNDLHLPDGSRLVVDITNPRPGYPFLQPHQAAGSLVDIRGRPIYRAAVPVEK